MLADLLLCCTAIPITPQYLLFKTWVLGRNMCKLFTLYTGLPVFVTSFSLMAIALDKHYHILHPTSRPIQTVHAVVVTIGEWFGVETRR